MVGCITLSFLPSFPRYTLGENDSHRLTMTNRNNPQSVGVQADSTTGTSHDDRFADSPIDRRQFMRLSAATAGALALPGNALADHESEKATDLYDFIRNHVESDYYIQTLILLDSEDGFDALADLDLGLDEDDDEDDDEDLDVGPDAIEVQQTTDPQPAVYAHITPGQAASVLELDEVEQVDFSPGSNPFWQLGNYDRGVFPPADESVEYIGFNQMIDGMSHLAEQHSDRLNFYEFGDSAGHQNLLDGESEPQDMWVAELTNDITDEESFENKEKPIFSLSIHGGEHTGREAGTRLIERTLNGEEPEIDEWLDDAVAVFMFTNPDGWVVRKPHYIGQENTFVRQNAADVDLNRAFPTDGWIDPDHYPGEPWGANLEDDQPGEIDDDVPEEVLEHVPDALSIAVQIRSYENVNALIDMHNMGWSPEPVESRPFVYSLTQNSNQFDHGQFHDADEMTRVVGEYIREELGPLDQYTDALLQGAEIQAEGDEEFSAEDMVPELIYRDSSSVDTLGYTTTGGLRSFVGGRDEFSGLDQKGVTLEMLFSPNAFLPDLLEVQVDAYFAAIRAVVDHASSTVEGTIETDGRSTAYAASETLTRTADDLVFTDTEAVYTVSEETLDDASDTEVISFDVSEDAGQISVRVEHTNPVVATLSTPADEEVETYDSDAEMEREAEWNITDPEPGDWSVEVENQADEENMVSVTAQQLLMEENEDEVDGVLTPNPEEILGFIQADYEVTPTQYFTDNGEFVVDADLDVIDVDDLTDGVLLNDTGVAYDNAVINHDDRADDQGYCDQLDDFVDAGGNLVLTDRGVHLLSRLDNDLASGITEDDIESIDRQFALLEDDPDEDAPDDELPSDGKNLDHPLMDGVRVVQREIWTVAGLGYASDNIEAPMTLVDADAFEGAGGSIGSTTDNHVSVGALGDATESGIKVIGSVLPPALQTNLHPFGMLDYGIEFLGHVIMMNALGYDQQRVVDGDVVDVWNNPEERDSEPQ